MKYLITHSLNKDERLIYEMSGLFCYELRDSDFGNDIASIEEKVIVNNVGSLLTDEKIDMGKNGFVDYNEFCLKNEQVFKIKELIPKGKQKRYNQKINMAKIHFVNPEYALFTKIGIMKGNPQKAFENAIKNGMENPDNWKYLYTEKNRDYFRNVYTKEYISYSNKKIKNKEKER